MRNLSIILALSLLISCNSKTEQKESNSINAKAEEVKETVQATEKSAEIKDSKQPRTINSYYESSESILFSEIQWYKPEYGNVEIFKGINDGLMSYILFDYILENHIDRYRHRKDPRDTISIDLKDQSFSYHRIFASDVTQYDIEINKINSFHRLGFGAEEEMSDEEIQEFKDEHKRRLDAVPESLKNIIITERFIVRGSWDYKKLKGDSLTFSITAESYFADANTYGAYGEFGPYYTDKIHEMISVDLFEMMNGLGQSKKFNETDLEIIDKQDLTYIRNQFYARKGYKFKTEKMQKFFGPKPWYNGTQDDVTDQLSETEMYNIYFIKDIEEGKK